MTFQQLTGDRTTWINIERPTTADVEALRRIYPYIHPLNLEDVLSAIERPKIDDDPDYLFVVLLFPVWDATSRLTRASEVDFFVGRGYVVTVHDGVLKPLERLFESCKDEEDRHKLLGGGASHAFYVMLDHLFDYVFPILRRVDSNIHVIEEAIFTKDDRQIIRDIALLRRDIIALRRIIRQQVPILENLERVERRSFTKTLKIFRRHRRPPVPRARHHRRGRRDYRRAFGDGGYAAQSPSERRDADSDRLFGDHAAADLHFERLRHEHYVVAVCGSPQSFWIVNGFMLVTAAVMLIYFRRRNWL